MHHELDRGGDREGDRETVLARFVFERSSDGERVLRNLLDGVESDR
ncbi:hypothetical protein ACFWBF_11500 [Streptomyces sp. NPDC060028]